MGKLEVRGQQKSEAHREWGTCSIRNLEEKGGRAAAQIAWPAKPTQGTRKILFTMDGFCLAEGKKQ